MTTSRPKLDTVPHREASLSGVPVNLRQLEVFHAIIRAGSVTGAARDLCVSQPAISAVLKHTEQQLRIKLFERRGGRLSPTPEALALVPDVQDIFARIDTVTRTAQEMRDGRAGQIVIATSPTLVNVLLPDAVASLRREKPRLGIFMRSLPTALAIERVSRREADMGVIYAPVNDPATEVEPLASSEITCVVPRHHPLAQQSVVSAFDLENELVISLGPTTHFGSAIVSACRERNLPVPAVGIEASSSMTACLLTERGAGVALVDRLSAYAASSFSNLVFLPFEPTIKVGVELVFPRGRPRSRAVIKMTEILNQQIQQRP